MKTEMTLYLNQLCEFPVSMSLLEDLIKAGTVAAIIIDHQSIYQEIHKHYDQIFSSVCMTL
jgi:hypothetical protein